MPSNPSKNNTIRLVGEQAEAFDQQMDEDRDWFESSPEAFYFRPEIEGEFDEYLILGKEPPFVHAVLSLEQGDEELPLGWTCVIDLGRYTKTCEDPSGWRCRIRTSPPINGDVREALLEGVCAYIDSCLAALKKQAHKPKGKGFG